eukprot:492974_1
MESIIAPVALDFSSAFPSFFQRMPQPSLLFSISPMRCSRDCNASAIRFASLSFSSLASWVFTAALSELYLYSQAIIPRANEYRNSSDMTSPPAFRAAEEG